MDMPDHTYMLLPKLEKHLFLWILDKKKITPFSTEITDFEVQ